jgi:mannosidase alpha-like ER degradation enhancer 1
MYPEASGIGAGIDSFYEYALKWYIMSGKRSSPTCEIHTNFSYLGETEFLDVWDDAYATIMRYARAKDGFWVYQYLVLHFCDTD